jgi:prevent-host-death family protein
MEKELGVSKARAKFGDLVEQVQFQGDTFIINRNGKPAAAIVPIEVYKSWKRERSAFFDLIRQAQQLANLTPEEAERSASEAIVAVRAEDQNK